MAHIAWYKWIPNIFNTIKVIVKSKKTVCLFSITLLSIIGVLLVRHGYRKMQSNAQARQPNQAVISLGNSNLQSFKIVSNEITSTGQIVHATKNGVEKKIFIPRGMSVPENILDSTLFGQPKIPKQPNRPTDVLNSDLNFYGLVVDENSNVIAGANVNTIVLVMSPGQDAHSQTSSLVSGSDGRFSIEKQWGQQIMVKVSKASYLDTTWQTFRYGNIGGVEPRYYPDQNNPAVFVLYAKANSETNSASLFSFNKVFGLPHDGSSTRIDLTTGQIVPTGGDLIVSINCPEPYTNLKEFSWEISINVVGGGLIEAHPINNQIENMQDAPSDGYSEGFDLKYDANSPDYRRQLDDLYYISSRNGQVYAKVRRHMTTF